MESQSVSPDIEKALREGRALLEWPRGFIGPASSSARSIVSGLVTALDAVSRELQETKTLPIGWAAMLTNAFEEGASHGISHCDLSNGVAGAYITTPSGADVHNGAQRYVANLPLSGPQWSDDDEMKLHRAAAKIVNDLASAMFPDWERTGHSVTVAQAVLETKNLVKSYGFPGGAPPVSRELQETKGTLPSEQGAAERIASILRQHSYDGMLTSRIDEVAGEIAASLNGTQPTEEHKLAREILAELVRARAKFPGDNVTTLALVEEVGELAKATFEESRERVRKEAIQVAAMAMRVVLDGDSTLSGWRSSNGLDALSPGSAPPQNTTRSNELAARWLWEFVQELPLVRVVEHEEEDGERSAYFMDQSNETKRLFRSGAERLIERLTHGAAVVPIADFGGACGGCGHYHVSHIRELGCICKPCECKEFIPGTLRSSSKVSPDTPESDTQRTFESVQTEIDALRKRQQELETELWSMRYQPTCTLCGVRAESIGLGPGWMNSDQWDSVKAGDFFCQNGHERTYFWQNANGSLRAAVNADRPQEGKP